MADDPNPQSDTGGSDDAAAKPEGDKPNGDAPVDDPGKGTLLTGDADTPQGAPDEYADFSMPDGMDVNKALLDAAKPIFKDIGLTQIQSQQLVDMFASNVQAESELNANAYRQQQQAWQDEIKGDPVIGGDKLDENVGIAKLALDKFGTPGLLKWLDQGSGNNPDLVRLLHKVGLTLREDDPGGGEGAGGDAKTPAEIMYPKAAEA